MLGRSSKPDASTDEVRAINSWNWTTAAPTWSGMSVTQDSALQLAAVYGCITFITDEISTLPLHDDERLPKWVENPSEGLNRLAWTGQVVWSLVANGNAYLGVRTNGAGQVVALDPLPPDSVTARMVNGRKRFYVGVTELPYEVLHIPGRMLPGAIEGISPLEYARQTIGLGLAGLKYGAQFFDGEGNMPGVIEIPKVAQPDTLKSIASQWQRRRANGGRGLPGVLDDGASWKPTGVTNEQAQFLQSRRLSASEIAGQIFLIDPSDLGIATDGGSNLTYANLAQRNTRRVQVTLLPWIRRIESALAPYTSGAYRFNVDARLRGDTRESYETLAIALAAGFMTIDEVREILGMDPRPDETEAPTARDLAEMVQKIYLGVGIVLSADEAREILNSGGANLPLGFAPVGGTL
jgi:HK97 family phage portal protein